MSGESEPRSVSEDLVSQNAIELGREPSVPIPCEVHRNGDYGPRDSYGGLTKRELFAAMAMQGAMHALAIQADEFEEDEPVDPHPIARDAVRMADALLKELAK